MGVVLSLASMLLLAESALTTALAAEAPRAEPEGAANEGLADKLKANTAATACFVRDCLHILDCLSQNAYLVHWMVTRRPCAS